MTTFYTFLEQTHIYYSTFQEKIKLFLSFSGSIPPPKIYIANSLFQLFTIGHLKKLLYFQKVRFMGLYSNKYRGQHKEHIKELKPDSKGIPRKDWDTL